MNVRRMMFILLCLIAVQVHAADAQVIGNMNLSDAATKLEEVGDTETAGLLRRLEGDNSTVSFSTVRTSDAKPYQYTTHAFGYIATSSDLSPGLVDISDAGFIEGDRTLINQKVKITLDRLRVFDYPGKGVHNILFDFFAQHQTSTFVEDIHFSQIYRASQGQGAGITGYPVFIGLQVTSEGLKFRVSTINVKNEDDERFLSFLNGDTFKNGLQLIDSFNPLSPVVTSFATNIVQSVAQRNKNIPVQNFDMGLDFSNIRTRAKLREGSYIVVQAPDVLFDWTLWQFDPRTGQVVSKDDSTKTIPLNYVVFSISKLIE